MGATLDVISGGRLELGIGAGDSSTKQECIDFGIKFPKADERIWRLREAVYIIKRMWTENYCSYEGKYYSIRNVSCTPKPLQKPYPRVWIGGIGDKVLRVVAEHADACNFWELSPEEYKQRLAVLRQFCLSAGTNYQKIVKSWGGEILLAEKEEELRSKIESFRPRGESIDQFQKRCILGTPDQCYEKINIYINLGVTYFIFHFLDVDSLRIFSREVLPTLRRNPKLS
jgi:alkanesulfonate monooxygenase SsuD/methylene tetrahydromethanopterin reductase-like flavin-dependent oxidoreductase (luciferase family)